MTSILYNDDFYNDHSQMSISSAEEIIPKVFDYIKPRSVVDIGCGIGTWLKVWEKFDVNDVLGVDGDYINRDRLLISEEKFIAANLEHGFNCSRKFDLVTCLEVAEHINESESEKFVKSLCNLGDIILFSAAIPGQEGTYHVNEQYPDYWQKLFAKNKFVPVDCLRKRIWANDRVSTWYKQNLLFYVQEIQLNHLDQLKIQSANTEVSFLNLVHPETFNYKCKRISFYEGILKSPRRLFRYFLISLLLKFKIK
jgi:SAM-dependent methyltransferase